MNVAEGVRRVGIALTVVYVSAASIFVIGYANEQGRVEGQSFDLMRSGKCYGIVAKDERHAVKLLSRRFKDKKGTEYMLRAGPAQCEVDGNPWEQYAEGGPKPTYFFDLGKAIGETWTIALLAVFYYGIMWGIWRGVGWIVNGFRAA